MNMRKLLIGIMCVVACLSCNKQSAYYLSVQYETVAKAPQTDATLVREIAGGENYNSYKFLVADSLCILYTLNNPQGFYSIMNINNGSDMGTFCPKGRGPQESAILNFASEIYEIDGPLKADLLDGAGDRLFEWNITRSIAEGRTVYDTIRPFAWIETQKMPNNCAFRINDKEFFSCGAANSFYDLGQIVPPRYTVRSLSDNSVLREYNVFPDSVVKINNTGRWSDMDFFSQTYAISPDRSKVVMAMAFYPQINVLDLGPGNLNAYRLDGAPRPTIGKHIWYYSSVCCDDRHIYALCQNADLDELNSSPTAHEKVTTRLHVFDWNGNMVADQRLGGMFEQMYLDNGRLYVFMQFSGRMAQYRTYE